MERFLKRMEKSPEVLEQDLAQWSDDWLLTIQPLVSSNMAGKPPE